MSDNGRDLLNLYRDLFENKVLKGFSNSGINFAKHLE